MNILILGANSQIAQDFIKLKKNKRFIFFYFDHKQLNISNKKKLFKLVNKLKPDIIINFAAFTDVNLAEIKIKKSFNVNYQGVKYLSLISKKFNILLIHFSTDYVFDGNKKISYSERSKTNPLNVYGYHKLLSENIIRKNCKRFFIFRTSSVFSCNNINFVKKIIKSIKTNKKLFIPNDQTSCPTSSLFICKRIYFIINKYYSNKNIKFGIYHLVQKPCVSWYDFSKIIKNIYLKKNKIKKNINIESISFDNNSNVKRPQYSCLETKKFNNYFKLKDNSWKNDLVKIIKHL